VLPCLSFTPKTGIAFPKTGIVFFPLARVVSFDGIVKCVHQNKLIRFILRAFNTPRVWILGSKEIMVLSYSLFLIDNFTSLFN